MSEKEVMAWTTIARKDEHDDIWAADRGGDGCGLSTMSISDLEVKGMTRPATRLTAIKAMPRQQQPDARDDQRCDLRPEFFQIGLALGQIGLARRARCVRGECARRATAHVHSAVARASAHALDLSGAARGNEGAHAEDDVNEHEAGQRKLRGQGDLAQAQAGGS